jgi:hypothetical protein
LFGTEVPDNYCVTATATNVDSCTSEFSAAAYYVDMVLTGTRAANQHILEWTDVPGTYEYWVYGATNDAYFDPDTATPYGNRLAVVPDGTLTWSTTNGIGDTANNWTYQVISVDGYGEEFARSNRVGEYDVALP